MDPQDDGRPTAIARRVVGRSAASKERMRADHDFLQSETRLLLAEKRTAFSQIRTGISVALVPLSLGTVLIATSRYWNPQSFGWLLALVLLVAALLFAVGVVLITQGLRSAHAASRGLNKIRRSDTLVEELLRGEAAFAPDVRERPRVRARAVDRRPPHPRRVAPSSRGRR